MKIVMYDGSYLVCSKIEFGDAFVIVDDTKLLDYLEIQRIVEEYGF